MTVNTGGGRRKGVFQRDTAFVSTSLGRGPAQKLALPTATRISAVYDGRRRFQTIQTTPPNSPINKSSNVSAKLG